MRIQAHARSDVGRVRAGNEDAYYVGQTVFAVADGMGGHVAGEVAAQTALEPIAALDGAEFSSDDEAEEVLSEALRSANRRVVEKAEAEPSYRGMGTTLTAALQRDDRLLVAHVGDSRAYLLRNDQPIVQLTTDHTLVERLVREGRLSPDEADNHPQRNVITRAIGNEPDVVVDSLPPLRLEPGDQVVLCSDGLTGPIDDTEIAELLREVDDPEEVVQTLVDRANEAGGPDNITVVLLRTAGADAAAAAAPPGAAATDDGLGDTQLGDTQRVAAPERVRQITTREESGKDWADSMGRLGAPQGKGQRATGEIEKRPTRRRRGPRILAAVLGILLLAGIVGAGGWLILGAAYFVGEHEGEVAIFQGVPSEVGDVPLYRVLEDEEIPTVPVDALPEYNQEQVRERIGARDLADARAIVESLDAERVDGDDDTPAGDTEPAGGADGEDDDGAAAAGPDVAGTPSRAPAR